MLFVLLQLIAEMAGKFFKSFFPSVKAQEEAELVNPQEVLRVSGSLDIIQMKSIVLMISDRAFLGGMWQRWTH